MKAWRKSVMTRDNYTCQACDKRGGDMEIDHILPFALFPALRVATCNGRTLCKACHSQHGAKVHGGAMVRPASAVKTGTNWLIW